ncbi:NtrZ family periplasmic regulatory protein [Phenylobacterium sp.]|uniref:NtrZ family periplasmic regulatory protein n=1 Tax=Phenylobacterium sp. TaxID=1871053 RepID=UPI002F3EC665
MSVRRFAALVGLTALLGAATTAAQAATVSATPPPSAAKSIDLNTQADASSIAPGLKWDTAKGKWGVTFNVQQPETRSTTLNDIQAGAYYKITPSLRVGGAFSFGSQAVIPGPKPNTPDNTQPRVQLETKLRF